MNLIHSILNKIKILNNFLIKFYKIHPFIKSESNNNINKLNKYICMLRNSNLIFKFMIQVKATYDPLYKN